MAIYQSQYTGKQIDEAVAKQEVMAEQIEKNYQIAIRNSKQIENLKQGTADHFETDSSIAYVKNVPENALPYAEIKKIGGMTYKDGNTLKSAKVTEVESVGVNLLKTVNGTHILPNGVGLTLDNGYFEMKITDSVREMPSTWWHQYTTVRLQAGTYTMSLSNFKGSNCTLFFANKTDNVDLRSEVEAKNESWNFTVNKETDVAFGLYIYHPSGITETVSGEFMLNKGSTALPYRPYVKHTLPIPEAVQALDGYGEGLSSSYQNAVDFENRKYIQWVRRLTQSEKVLRETDFQYENIKYYQITKSGTADYDKTTTNILVSNFEIYKGSESWESADRIGTVTGAATYGWYWFGFPVGTTLEQAQEIVNQADILVTTLGYESDISDILSADNLIEVEGGGTLTFKNEYEYAVPSEVEYQVEV